jgi:ElaB/YqjD/DUF883 family membrane-anchored ribosome-binding protein
MNEVPELTYLSKRYGWGLLQMRDSLVAENEKLQERLDEQGADLYFIQQEQKEITKLEERVLEVCHHDAACIGSTILHMPISPVEIHMKWWRDTSHCAGQLSVSTKLLPVSISRVLSSQSAIAHIQLEAAKGELESSLSNLRNQLNVEQQAHTQTQQREGDAQKHYQEILVQAQLSKHELESAKADLQATRSAQHTDCLQIIKLQQQLAAREDQGNIPTALTDAFCFVLVVDSVCCVEFHLSTCKILELQRCCCPGHSLKRPTPISWTR